MGFWSLGFGFWKCVQEFRESVAHFAYVLNAQVFLNVFFIFFLVFLLLFVLILSQHFCLPNP